MTSQPDPVPVPKPRSRYIRDSLRMASSLDGDQTGESQQSTVHKEDAPPADGGVVFPTLTSITDIIATNIPSLAGFATTIGGSAPSSSTPSAPSTPPSIDSISSNIAAHIPSLAGTTSALAYPASATLNSASTTRSVPAANTGSASLDRIFSSLVNMHDFAPIVSNMDSKGPPPSLHKTGDTHTDVEALPRLGMTTSDQNAEVTVPRRQSTVESTEEGFTSYPHLYGTVLASWASQEEPDTDSSNEEEDTKGNPEGPLEAGHSSSAPLNANNVPPNAPSLVPTRRAPPPPCPPGRPGKSVKQKIPRAATIRVSRKKGGSGNSSPQGAVVRASWLDVWKGFRYTVLWATLDGQLMSLWKKRTDRFSEVLFHVSSITNVKKQDKCRFSIYFRKKHYDFMAHNDEIHDAWVTSLLASRGQISPAAPDLHGQITMKDTRSRAYAAVWGHDLWIYPNKEGFQLGVASFSVPLNVAMVKSIGKHSFTLITPYKTFNISVDSSKDLSNWLDNLSSTIRSALSCSQVALRLWENPNNKVCGDCGSANPEWASVNLLLVICHTCAGQHRGLGSKVSKVRSLKMDNKVWTEPLIKLFLKYGNRLANQVWAPAVPAVEQLRPDSSDEERSRFIKDKYSRGRYRRVHSLASSHSLMEQRLCQVVCGSNIEETMSLICSGAKVCPSDPQNPSPIMLAEKAGQALQTELLRLNEYSEFPPYQPQSLNRWPDSATSGEADEDEELHGKLEEDRFLFSVENNSAACDVLDLREVLSVFVKDGPAHEFELVTLNDQLICAADHQDALLSHMVHILKVILPAGVSYAEVGGASAVSKVCVVEVGGASSQSDAWLLLWEDGISVHPIFRHAQHTLKMDLSEIISHEMDPSKNIITMVTADRSVSFRFEEQHSCQSWYNHLQAALNNQKPAPPHSPAPGHSSAHQSLYPVMDVVSRGSVPQAIERCISHITTYGLKVEGVYRRCGLASKVTELVKVLITSPNSAPLESNEQGVLDAASALKLYVRQQESLIPDRERQQWMHAAVISDERTRFSTYRRLLQQLPDDNRATLNALFGHFYMVQMFSQVNKMSAHNLAVVVVPTLFQTMNQDLLRLSREFIIHHTLLFLTPQENARGQKDVQLPVF